MMSRPLVIASMAACLVMVFYPAAPVRADTMQPLTIWCNQLLSPDAGPPAVVVYEKAEASLCHGQFAQARDGFASIVPYWIKNQNNGRWWLDTARGYFYSLIASGDDQKARNFLTTFENTPPPAWEATTGDRLFWAGDVRGAFAAYAVAADAELARLPDDGTDKVLENAAHASGDMNAAIAILQGPSGQYGPSDIGSLQLLMLGEAYETQLRWPDAFAAWVRAANNGHAVPEYDFLDQWNESALEMIYYYRTHIPSDQRS
jgi:hypothetical protein